MAQKVRLRFWGAGKRPRILRGLACLLVFCLCLSPFSAYADSTVHFSSANSADYDLRFQYRLTGEDTIYTYKYGNGFSLGSTVYPFLDLMVTYGIDDDYAFVGAYDTFRLYIGDVSGFDFDSGDAITVSLYITPASYSNNFLGDGGTFSVAFVYSGGTTTVKCSDVTISGGTITGTCIAPVSSSDLTALRVRIQNTNGLGYGTIIYDYAVSGFTFQTLSFSIESQNTSLLRTIIDYLSALPDKISAFFTALGDRISGFFDDLLAGIKEFFEYLFKPSDDFFTNLQSELDEYLTEHLGAVYQVPEYLISELTEMYNGLTNSSGDSLIITMPDISFTLKGKTYVLCDSFTYDLLSPIDSLSSKAMINTALNIGRWLITFSLAVGLTRMVYKRIINKVGVEGGDEL
ncbi:MAG: hypothetical protein LUH82_03770 [Clostridiales bacterium]|nr:hypothetical protein [Clostridiales bacterium]